VLSNSQTSFRASNPALKEVWNRNVTIVNS
jgi:hypothetical protein